VIARLIHEVVAGVDHEHEEVPTDPLAARRSLPRVAVVGRPNVGKSTLVNRIIGTRVAIVEERPGVTRDRTEHLAEWNGRPFIVVDTGGWEHRAEGMAARIVAQAEAAIAHADLVLFVVDGTVGALEDDERYARCCAAPACRPSSWPTRSTGRSRSRWSTSCTPSGSVSRTASPPGTAGGWATCWTRWSRPCPRRRTRSPTSRRSRGWRSSASPTSASPRCSTASSARSARSSTPCPTPPATPWTRCSSWTAAPWVFVDTAGMRRHYRRARTPSCTRWTAPAPRSSTPTWSCS
jgi:hypothetical protein